MRKTCSQLKAVMVDGTAYEHMYTDDVHRYIYCVIGKTSCTSWKRVLLTMAGFRLTNDATVRPEQLPFLKVHNKRLTNRVLKRLVNFTADGIQFRLNNYFKFVFVREPLERLVSAYRDKMLRDADYLKHVVPVIIKKYRSDKCNNSRNSTDSSKYG